ncbi:Uncharacterized protein TCM_041665 [Theobroma cacao]|uniref:Uncharacterized protein n=1 Tax=Theobroma cacao TaxID=3641 RepID=A0A061GVC7_THECC|nr:Uncharacterized protein TCM_041665 [Theobroma cacao]
MTVCLVKLISWKKTRNRSSRGKGILVWNMERVPPTMMLEMIEQLMIRVRHRNVIACRVIAFKGSQEKVLTVVVLR